MKKYVLLTYKIIVSLALVVAIVFVSLTVANLDEMVTENITLKYFEKSMNEFDKEKLDAFVADSENNILYTNALRNYEIYHSDTVVEYSFEINEYEVFGNGKYQCYFNYYDIPTCDVNYEGKYMNYLIETTTKYKTKFGETGEVKEKGLVVFVKDGSNGNIFEWKLVRYDRETNN